MELNTPGTSPDEKLYPTPPDSDGFFYEDEENEALKIESQKYENGKEVRRVTLSDGKKAIVRQLTGSEMGTTVNRLIGNNKDDYQYAMVAVAAKIDDKGLMLEDVKDMLGKDYIKLQAANSQINF